MPHRPEVQSGVRGSTHAPVSLEVRSGHVVYLSGVGTQIERRPRRYAAAGHAGALGDGLMPAEDARGRG